MKDERSKNAVIAAERFGNGLADKDELAAAYAAARQKNQALTADICREVIGQLIIDAVNSLENKQEAH